jgi:hypothetical protein
MERKKGILFLERVQTAAISRLAFSLGEGAQRADEVTKGDTAGC